MWPKQKHSGSGKDRKRKSDGHDHVQNKNRKQNECVSDVSEQSLSIEKRGNKGKSDIGTPSCSNKRQNHVSFTISSTESSGSDSENNNSVSAVPPKKTQKNTPKNNPPVTKAKPVPQQRQQKPKNTKYTVADLKRALDLFYKTWVKLFLNKYLIKYYKIELFDLSLP